MMNPLGHKLNNSYESEQSSSNGSINEANTSESASAVTPPLSLPELFAVDRINALNVVENGSDNCRVSATEFEYDSEQTQYSNTFSSAEISDQNERVYKELGEIKLTKILKSLTSHQSPHQCTLQQNYCDRNIDKSPSIIYNMENSCNATDNKIAKRNSAHKYDKNLTFKLDIGSNSRRTKTIAPSTISTRTMGTRKTPIKPRPQSPDLFDDFSDSENNNISDNNDAVLEHSVLSEKGKESEWEKSLLKRIQASLSGVLPPPSKTIIQYNSTELLDIYNENLTKMSGCDGSESKHTESLFKPTHTVDEVKTIGWNDMNMGIKCHGLLYNRTTDSEEIELLGMKYVERCVGVETSSSFTHTYRPSANKLRMKMLSQSPGTRLSHLVGRKRGLSAANLLSKQCGSDSSKLGSKQLMIDVQKNCGRRRKAATPKRRTPAKKKTPGRKTPGSARKRATLSTKSMAPTRETSKRALFQSPPQQKPKCVKPTIPEDVARRVDKSKRMLFSPSTDERDAKPSNSFSQPIGKRRRDEDGLLGNQSKLPRIGGIDDIRTSRTMLAKSQTFCVNNTINNEPATGSSVLRARSDVTLNGQQLSQSHRRKLLWAVSTSLRKKNINSQHKDFTAFASVLAKVVKRLFLETRDESTSTSDTMIRIADRLVFWVVQGKSIDEIYLNEKMRKENLRAASKIKLKGYIGPEDYEKLKKPIQKVNSNLFLSQSSTDSFNFSQQSFSFSTQTTISQNTEGLLNDLSLSNNCFNETNSLGAMPETVNYALCGSSSKSNTSGSVLRENVRESELKQKSGQKLIEFSGKDQKNVSPYHDKVYFVGGSRTNIMNVKRQISFDA
ncbi:uncharacterized protein LOC119078870 isoform X2 [Bradysia coprophila]|uniref:uncharacterized protein LOC119078870 isoform X1 n=1 Tax=Bradysia coprophila TaxID=38358 RepID=UPI00187D776C|nr:uncharacterized protein LOC119078870 isoform X1 [Bradysia coprophila]XP_037042492.1 uncharacterized protein LOC119078870 isoform X2 [Bradysia coprophila]